MNTFIHDKDPQSSQEFKPSYCNKSTARRHPWNVGDPKPVHIRVIKVSSANRWNNRKMVRFTASIYRIKSGQNTFLDCVQYLTLETEKQRALGKHHSTMARLRRVRLSCQLVERKKCACATGQTFWTRPIPLRSLIQRVWLFASYRANQSPITTIVETW